MAFIKYVLQGAKQYPWEFAGSITVSQAALTTAKDYQTVNDLAVANRVIIVLPDLHMASEFRFITDSNNDANVVNLYAMAGDKDYYTLIATLTLTGGTQIAPNEKVFCDTLDLSVEQWPTPMANQSAATDNIASLILNTHGYKNFLMLATTLANILTVYKRRA